MEYEKKNLGRPMKLLYDGSDESIKIVCLFLQKTFEETDATVPRSVVFVKEVLEPGDIKEGDLVFKVKSGKEMRLSKGQYLIYDPVKNEVSIGKLKKSIYDRFDNIQG